MSIIYVDGACNKVTGDEAWGSVVNQESKDIIIPQDHIDLDIRRVTLPVGIRNVIICKFNDVKSQQNNGSELLSLVVGLRIAMKNPNIKIVYSDSSLMVDWWSKGHVNKKTLKTMDKLKYQYILECTSLRSEFEKRGGQVLKIAGKDNLADLGYHIG